MSWLKWLLAVGAVASVAAAVVWFADLGAGSSAQAENSGGQTAATETVNSSAADTLESLIAQKSGLSIDTINKLEVAALSAAADKGAAFGLTPSQTANLKPEIVSPIVNDLFGKAAQAAGVSNSDLFNGLENGQSLAQIGAAHGKDAATLKASLSAAVQGQITAAQNAGVVNSIQAPIIASMLTSQLDKIIAYAHQAEQKTR